MKKVGLLGGTFNPPHIGHLMMANEVLHALDLDEVRFMPNARPPHKQARHDASDDERIEMVKLSIAPYPNFRTELFEVNKGGVSYSYETLAALCAREPNVKFYFIIGGDMIDTLHTWYCIEDLAKLVQFVGVRRPGQRRKRISLLEWWMYHKSIYRLRSFVNALLLEERCHFYCQKQ